jgi:tape measure domain-containing protein
MALSAGAVIAKFQADISAFQRGVATAKASVSSLGKGFKAVGSELASAGKAISIGMGVAATGMTALATAGLKTAGDLEAQRQGFIALLGSTEAADEAIRMIKRDAAATPFELPGLIEANKLLTTVTEDAPRSERFLLNIGKALATAGKGQAELDRIIVNLQQIGAVGKASMIDIKQFAFAGIPIFKMLEEEFGVTGEALEDMISGGEVSFEKLEQMFNSAGEEGGKFAKGFEAQAGTFNQLWSNLKDTYVITMDEIVRKTGLFDIVKKTLGTLINFIDANKDSIVNWLVNTGNQIVTFFNKAKAFFEPLIVLIKNFFSVPENRKAFFIAVFVAIGVAIGAFVTAFLIAHATIIGIFTALIAIVTFFQRAWQENWLGVRTVLTSFISFLFSFVETWINTWKKIIDFFIKAKDIIAKTIEEIKKNISEKWQSIKEFLFLVLNEIVDNIRNFFSMIASTIREKTEQAKQEALAIWNALKSGIISVANAILSSVTSAWNTLKSTLISLTTSIKDSIISAWNSLKSTVVSLAISLKDGVLSAWNSLKSSAISLIENMADGIMGAFEDLASGAIEWGTHLVQNFADGILAGLDWVTGAIDNLINTAKEKMGFSYNKFMPSEIWGEHMIQNFADGIKTALPDLTKALDMSIGNVTAFGENAEIGGEVTTTNQTIVNQSITANISDEIDVETLSERLAFKYRNA